MKTLPVLAAKPFLSILETCEQGVQVPDSYIRTHACAALDHIFTMVVEETERCQGSTPSRRHLRRNQHHHQQQQTDWVASSSSAAASSLRRLSSSSTTASSDPINILTAPSNNNSNPMSSLTSPSLSSSSSTTTSSFLATSPTSTATSATSSSAVSSFAGYPYWCLETIQACPSMVTSLFISLYSLILFDENNDQWQLSRPLYVLILVQKEVTCPHRMHILIPPVFDRTL